MERLAIISHNSFRAIGFHKSRSPSSPYGPALQGSQLITLEEPQNQKTCQNSQKSPHTKKRFLRYALFNQKSLLHSVIKLQGGDKQKQPQTHPT